MQSFTFIFPANKLKISIFFLFNNISIAPLKYIYSPYIPPPYEVCYIPLFILTQYFHLVNKKYILIKKSRRKLNLLSESLIYVLRKLNNSENFILLAKYAE